MSLMIRVIPVRHGSEARGKTDPSLLPKTVSKMVKRSVERFLHMAGSDVYLAKPA